MDLVIIILRLLHIGAGVFWVGAAFMLFLFVTPTLKALGPETQKNFMTYVTRRRKLVPIVVTSTIVTVAAGAALFWISSDGLNREWLSSGFGIGLSIGALAAIVAFVMGIAILTPTMGKVEKLSAEIEQAGRPPTAEQVAQMTTLAQRLQMIGLIDAVLLAIAVIFMAIARYL